jgi:hypothetical protein
LTIVVQSYKKSANHFAKYKTSFDGTDYLDRSVEKIDVQWSVEPFQMSSQ